MSPTSIAGIIEYVTDGIGRTGVEHFRITRGSDGGRRLRAYCEMHDDRLVRDAMLSVNDAWRPLDAYVAVAIDGKPIGNAHYAFDGAKVSWQQQAPKTGITSETRELPSPASAFGSHSVQNDAWFYAAFDRVRAGESETPLENVVVCSKLANGGEPPTLIVSTQRHRYRGEESVTTPAGTFATCHYTFHFDRWPPIHYWVHGDDYLLIKAQWDHLRQSYTLIEVSR